MPPPAPDRLLLTYEIAASSRGDALERAGDIALEQTVELPARLLAPDITERVAGRVETVEALGEQGYWRTVISYEPAVAGDDLPQLLNLLYGNVSLLPSVRLVDLFLPVPLLDRFTGPRFGIEGLRALCGTGARRPLLCVALKPVGLSAAQLADLGDRFARAGVDLVKDDHGLANQASAPFDERVRRCQDAVSRANAATGGRTLYVPNLTGPIERLDERVALLRTVGCQAALVSPLLVGLDAVRALAESSGLALLAHPAMAGAFFHARHGIAHELLLGTLFRLVGSDGVIYPNAGGRFPFTRTICDAVNRRLREPLAGIRPAFPVPGGGIDAAKVPYWMDAYGPDTIFLVGGSLYAQPDVQEAARRLVESVRMVNR